MLRQVVGIPPEDQVRGCRPPVVGAPLTLAIQSGVAR